MTGEELRAKFTHHIYEQQGKKEQITWEMLSDGRKKVWDDLAADLIANQSFKGPEMYAAYQAGYARTDKKHQEPNSWEVVSESTRKMWDNVAEEVVKSIGILPVQARYAYKGEPRKVLISPGFGAGWSTWNSEYRHEFLFDPELIAAVERFDRTGDRQADREAMQDHLGLNERGMNQSLRPGSPLANFEERMKLEYGDGDDGFHAYYGGADDLTVVEVDGQFIVDEYDGSESVTLRGNDDGWI